jgi:hypothetical protein
MAQPAPASGTSSDSLQGKILGFLAPPPTDPSPHSMVARCLRWLGILVLVNLAVSVLNTLLRLAGVDGFGNGRAAAAAGAIIGLLIGIAIAAAICFWITYTVLAWLARRPDGTTHVLILGILATVFGALGVLGALGLGAFGAAFGLGGSGLFIVMALLDLLISAATLVLGILLLVNRSKATAGAPQASGYQPHS